MKNLLTFTTASGTTQLRGYVKIALGLLAILVTLFGVNAYNRNQMVTEVMATPRPLETGQMTAPTEKAVVPVQPVAEECPSDPADWILTENLSVPGSNLKGLSPQCVYDQLEKTAAWLYTTHVLGYSRSGAARFLGFSEIPMEYSYRSFENDQISVLTDFKDAIQKVDLVFPNDHPSLKEWFIDANGSPSVEFVFSGCFRTSSMSGGEVKAWGEGYPIVCQFAKDSWTAYYIGDVSGKVVTAGGADKVRRLMWFGYAGDGDWVFLGVAEKWEYELAQIRNRDGATINATVMAEKYSVNPVPLPENWMAFTNQEFADAFLEELDGSN